MHVQSQFDSSAMISIDACSIPKCHDLNRCMLDPMQSQSIHGYRNARMIPVPVCLIPVHAQPQYMHILMQAHA